MAVLTQKEYNEKKGVAVEKTAMPVIESKQEKPKQEELSFYHTAGLSFFEDEININGRTIKRKYENGIIKTSDPDLIEFLKSTRHLLVKEPKMYI